MRRMAFAVKPLPMMMSPAMTVVMFMIIVIMMVMMPIITPARADPRVRTVPYAEDAVVPLTGHYGYQMLVELDGHERIQNISIGDSVAWLVTPSKSATSLFLKPVEPNAATNMTVVTDRRTYLFDLKAAPRGRAAMTYRLRFRYPETRSTAVTVAAPSALNRAYRISGDTRIRPAQVQDDGRATYFHWPARQALPAIFVADGKEELVNHRVSGGWIAVDRIARRFVLRAGKDKAVVTNKAWHKPRTAGASR